MLCIYSDLNQTNIKTNKKPNKNKIQKRQKIIRPSSPLPGGLFCSIKIQAHNFQRQPLLIQLLSLLKLRLLNHGTQITSIPFLLIWFIP